MNKHGFEARAQGEVGRASQACRDTKARPVVKRGVRASLSEEGPKDMQAGPW